MENLQEVVFGRLRALPAVWRQLFRDVAGLDVSTTDLSAELARPLTINRDHSGFQDFSLFGERGIEPGDPALSLVYHALASPLVQPKPVGGEPASAIYPADLPTLLDLLENYVWGLAPFPDLPKDAVVAVFAYEYRPAESTAHRTQADFVYSRTGIARVGEVGAVYDPVHRCYLSSAPGDPNRFAVMPARYAAFIAVPRKPGANAISVLGDKQDADDDRTFLLPIRKLFTGDNGNPGPRLRVSFTEYHRQEKLGRLFTVAGLKPYPDSISVDASEPPYTPDSSNTPGLVRLSSLAGSVWLNSTPQSLVREAKRKDGLYAAYVVPAREHIPLVGLDLNRHYSSFMIITDYLKALQEQIYPHGKVRPRNAPEFVNMRREVVGDKPGQQTVTDLNGMPDPDFKKKLDKGGYGALLYEDSTCDGCVIVQVDGFSISLPIKPAFSVVAAPDFFPYADERGLNDWVDQTADHNRLDQFKEGSPDPLCHGRLAADQTICWPGPSAQRAFDPDDETMVAMAGRPYAETKGRTLPPPVSSDGTTSYLTDACSNEFAPGWDVTFAEQDGVRFYTNFGLGSPFPEDVKFCAAANSYWPAAVPDASCSFHYRSPTAIPMLDGELGYHPNNPNIPPGAIAGPGWDGEYGPFLETLPNRGEAVNFASIDRSDYILNVLAGKLSGKAFHTVTTEELIRRMNCLRFCIQTLPDERTDWITLTHKAVDNTALWLISARAVSDWATIPGAAPFLREAGYVYIFAVPSQDKSMTVDGDVHRLRQIYNRKYECQVTPEGMRWRQDSGNWNQVRF